MNASKYIWMIEKEKVVIFGILSTGAVIKNRLKAKSKSNSKQSITRSGDEHVRT